MADPTHSQRSRLAMLLRRLPWIVIALGIALFTISLRSDLRSEDERLGLHRTTTLERLEHSITDEIDRHLAALVSAEVWFAGVEDTERDDFAAALSSSGVLDRHPELEDIRWVPGVEWASQPNRLGAIERARLERTVVATEPLVEGADDQSPGVLFVSPVFDSDLAPPDDLEGVLLTTVEVPELVERATDTTWSFVLSDMGATDSSDDSAVVLTRTEPTTSASEHILDMKVAGRTWQIALGDDSIGTSSTWAAVLGSLPTLIAAAATAIVLSTLSRDTERSERRAQELTAEVRQKNEELMRSNEWLESFTRVASHDLRSPLRAVTSLVGFIREDHPDLDESVTFNLMRIEQRVERMNTLIDDLLTLARVTDGAEAATHVQFETLVGDVLETVEVPQGFTVEQRYSGAPRAALAALQFKTCVQNLVDNAIKHHDREDGNVTIGVDCAGDFVTVRVTDDGPGIPEQYLDSVFEPFRRLRPDETSPGSGIGLTAILRTVEINGGSIAVESIVDSGTTFTLTWPVDALAPRPELEGSTSVYAPAG